MAWNWKIFSSSLIMLFLKVEQDFTLLFGDETSSRLLQKWDVFFKPNIIQEAKQLTSTPELRRLIQSAESSSGSDEETSELDLFFLGIYKSVDFFLNFIYLFCNSLFSLVPLCPQPMTKKWPPCCCWYISFHHHLEDQSRQKLVHVMQLRDLLSFTR